MKVDETYIAKMQGGIFFDPFPAASREFWGTLSEKVRPAVRECLSRLGLHEKLDIDVVEKGFIYEYTINSLKRSISVSKDGVTFDSGRFRIADGFPRDVVAIVESIVKMIGREDWIEIGSVVYFVIPAKDAKGTTIGADMLRKFFFKDSENRLKSVFKEENMQVVDFSIKGNSEKTRLTWNVVNSKKEQNIMLSLDVKMYRHDLNNSSIANFTTMAFDMFMERCAPLIQEIISSSEFAPYLDADFLIKGET